MRPESSQLRTSRGAYGLRITGIAAREADLVNVPESWERLHVELLRGAAEQPQPPGTVRLTDQRGEIWLPGGDRIEVLRDPLTVRITSRDPVRPDSIAHPYLGLPASMVGRWMRRIALHGGAFVHRNRAWAVLGTREAGKSAMLGGLMRAGRQIVSDDILIIQGRTVFAGPRTVDLRADASNLLGGEELGVIGSRTRWRLRPPPVPARMELAGLVFLEWGHRARLEPLAPEARLRALIESSVFSPRDQEAVALLELTGLPAWRFERPPTIGELGDHAAQLLAALEP